MQDGVQYACMLFLLSLGQAWLLCHGTCEGLQVQWCIGFQAAGMHQAATEGHRYAVWTQFTATNMLSETQAAWVKKQIKSHLSSVAKDTSAEDNKTCAGLCNGLILRLKPLQRGL